MSEEEKRILAVFEKVIPKLNDDKKKELLYFGEGMAFMAEREEREKQTA